MCSCGRAKSPERCRIPDGGRQLRSTPSLPGKRMHPHRAMHSWLGTLVYTSWAGQDLHGSTNITLLELTVSLSISVSVSLSPSAAQQHPLSWVARSPTFLSHPAVSQAPTHHFGVTAVLVSGIFYAISSCCLTLLNKHALAGFGFTAPNALLFFQCGLTGKLSCKNADHAVRVGHRTRTQHRFTFRIHEHNLSTQQMQNHI